MDLLSRALGAVSDGAKWVLANPTISVELSRAVTTHRTRMERLRFARLVFHSLVFLLLCAGVFVFIRLYETNSVVHALNSVICVCSIACIGITLLSVNYFLNAEEERYRKELNREIIYATFKCVSHGIRYRKPLKKLVGEVETLVETLNALFILFSPIIAILGPSWHSWWRLAQSISILDKRLYTVHCVLCNLYRFVRGGLVRVFETVCLYVTSSRRRAAITASLVALFALAGGWATYRHKQRISSTIPTRVVPRRRQEISDDTSDCPPALSATVLAQIPGSPKFKGSELVLNSMVRIKASYIATAFRVGNNLVTAIHCIGKKNINV